MIRLICALGGVEVVGEAEDGPQAVALAERLGPDVVLMEIDLPLLNGVQATEQIVKANPAARVIMLTCADQDSLLVAALKARRAVACRAAFRPPS